MGHDCSIMVGMHPDQAAGWIAEIAVAASKPFAIVPCCVYSVEFPKRKGIDGMTVRSYDQLLSYLETRAPGVRRRALDFEGKNIVVYWSPDWPSSEPARAATVTAR